MTASVQAVRWVRAFDVHRPGDVTLEARGLARVFVDGGYAVETDERPARRATSPPVASADVDGPRLDARGERGTAAAPLASAGGSR